MYRIIAISLLLSMLTQCAPLWIAAGVELEHDDWCQTHQSDSHCR